MEVVVIGKPAINVYLPLQEFPQEGDLFNIATKNESVGNVAATSACLLGKWGLKPHFSGVVGNDSYAEKVRDTFKENNVNFKFLETNFSSGTCTNYIILNAKTGITTKVLYNDFEAQLTKYKYDFTPGFAILDGTDMAGTLALLNNSGSTVKTLLYARKADKDTISLSKKCTYVVCTENFAVGLTKEQPDGSAEGYVNMYQKIVDICGRSNYIVILNNHKILYAVDGAVKMLPEMKINIVDSSSFDSVFVGSLAMALIKDLSLDDGIKFANTAAGISLTKIGEEASIPSIEEVLDNSGMREKFGLKENASHEPAIAQEVTPLMPNVNPANKVPEQTFNNMNMVAQTPVNNTGFENVNSAPIQTSANVSTDVAAQAFDVTGFKNTPPLQTNAVTQQTPVQTHETNIFDNPNE